MVIDIYFYAYNKGEIKRFTHSFVYYTYRSKNIQIKNSYKLSKKLIIL